MKLRLQDYIDYIKLQTSGDLIELEIPDETIGKYVNAALVELCRYIDETKFVTVPFSRCIDLTDWDHSSIINVYRTNGPTSDLETGYSSSQVDPMYAQQWAIFSNGGRMYNLKNYVLNYLSYNTLLQMRNTSSTDLNFVEDKNGNKLYINCSFDIPSYITIEYIPVFTDVEQVTSDYWIDILKRLSLAMVKVGLGRIRTRFKQTNALWDQDGETLLAEGNEELKELRENLRVNSNYFIVGD